MARCTPFIVSGSNSLSDAALREASAASTASQRHRTHRGDRRTGLGRTPRRTISSTADSLMSRTAAKVARLRYAGKTLSLVGNSGVVTCSLVMIGYAAFGH